MPRKKTANHFRELLILAYFKQSKEYSFTELSELLGFTITKTADMVRKMIDNHYLEYKDNLLTLSWQGRIQLQNSSMENYDFLNDYIEEEKYREKAWPLEKVYIPEDFKK